LRRSRKCLLSSRGHNRYESFFFLLNSGLISLSARCSVAKGLCIRRRPARIHKGRRPLCLLDFDSTNKFFTSPHSLTNYLVHRRKTGFTLIYHVLLRSIHGNHLFQLQMVCVMAVEAVPVSHNCLYLVPESTRFDEQIRHRFGLL
jgi:hypothetical protein